MSDVRILLVCIAVLSLTTFIEYCLVNSAPINVLDNSIYQTVNKYTDLTSPDITVESINLQNIKGYWDVAEGYGIYPTKFDTNIDTDLSTHPYAICQFGNKEAFNNMISENITIEGVNYNVTDEFGLSLLYIEDGKELYLNNVGGQFSIVYKNYYTLSRSKFVTTGYGIGNDHEVSIRYTYFMNNETLHIEILSPQTLGEWVTIYNKNCDFANYVISASDKTHAQRLQMTNDLLNQSVKFTRIGTSIPSYHVTSIISNTITGVLTVSYNFTSNPIDFVSQLWHILSMTVRNDQIPFFMQFLLIGLWELGIVAWIIAAVVRGD